MCQQEVLQSLHVTALPAAGSSNSTCLCLCLCLCLFLIYDHQALLDMVANVVKLDQIPHLSPRPSSSSSINLLLLLPTMQFLQISFLFVVTFLACLQLISNNEEQTCLLLNQSLELDELEELEQHLGKIIVTSKILQATIFNCGAQFNHFQLQQTKPKLL